MLDTLKERLTGLNDFMFAQMKHHSSISYCTSEVILPLYNIHTKIDKVSGRLMHSKACYCSVPSIIIILKVTLPSNT